MIDKKKILLGLLSIIATAVSIRAAISLGLALETLISFWRFLAPSGRAGEVVYDLTLLIPGAFWATVGAISWVAFFAVKKQQDTHSQ